MDKIIVGDNGCTFSQIIQVMTRSPVFCTLNTKWPEISLSFGTEKAVKDEIRRRILIDATFKTVDVIEKLLVDWRSRECEKATLERLVQILHGKGLGDVADEVVKWFKEKQDLKCEDDSSDDDHEENETVSHLTEHIQYYISDLIEATVLSDEMLWKLQEQNIFKSEDAAVLEAVSNVPEERNLIFYKIMQKRMRKSGDDTVYEAVFNVISTDPRNQKSGVTMILNRAFE